MVSYGNYNYFGLAPERSELTSAAAKKFSFYSLCDYLEKNPKTTKLQFHELLDQFYNKVSTELREEDENFSAYPLVRLLMPAKDQRRRLTDKMFRDALELIIKGVRVPLRGSAADYANFVHQHYEGSSSDMSIYDVNHLVKKMTTERSKKNQVIQEFCSKMTKLELTWIFRFLLQEISDTVVGRSNGRGLIDLTNYLSPKAEKVFQSGMDLESLCIGVYQAKQNGVELSNAMILGKPILPMLLSRLGFNTEDLMTVIKYCRRPFYVETKYDGEHFLLHRLNRGKEHKDYKFFSRRGLEHSNSSDQTNQLSIFAKKLHSFFKSSVENCVLDGELVVKDMQTGFILGKNVENEAGMAIDVKHKVDERRYKRVFVVFDVLFLNDQEYFERPLEERLHALNTKIFAKTDPNFVFISKKTEMTKMTDLQAFYFDHLKKGEEGIVIKGKQSIYNFGQRSQANGWFKIKPDYGPRAIIDVVVVGARYENKTYDHLRSFEIATLAGTNGRFRIIGGVQARLKKHYLDALIAALKLKKKNTQRPAYIEGVSDERCTLYADLSDIQVVEVKASGVINNQLQFPAITGFRPDKAPLEVSTWNQIADYGKKLRGQKRVLDGGNSVVTIYGKRMRREIMNKTVHRTPKRGKKNTPLKGIAVCLIDDVTNKYESMMQEAEETLKYFGADMHKNYSLKVQLAVSPKADGSRTRSVIGKNAIHIVSIDWVKRCKEADRVLKWNEDEIIYRCSDENAFNFFHLDETQAPEDESEDEAEVSTAVGDEFKQETDDDLETEPENDYEVEEEPTSNADDEVKSPSTTATLNNDDDLTIEQEEQKEEVARQIVYQEDDLVLPDDLFFGFTVLVFDSITPQYKTKIEKCGGTISSIAHSSITHVFFQKKYDFDGEDPAGIAKWLNENQWLVVLINEDWVDKAVRDDNRYLDTVPVKDLSI